MNDAIVFEWKILFLEKMIEIGLNKKRCKYVKIVAGVTYVLVSII